MLTNIYMVLKDRRRFLIHSLDLSETKPSLSVSDLVTEFMQWDTDNGGSKRNPAPAEIMQKLTGLEFSIQTPEIQQQYVDQVIIEGGRVFDATLGFDDPKEMRLKSSMLGEGPNDLLTIEEKKRAIEGYSNGYGFSVSAAETEEGLEDLLDFYNSMDETIEEESPEDAAVLDKLWKDIQKA